MEHHLLGNRDLAYVSTTARFSRRRGAGGNGLLSGLDGADRAYHGHETRSRAMGLHQTSVYVGTIAGGFFAGLIGQPYGWRWSFLVFGMAGILLGIVLHPREEPAATQIADTCSGCTRQPCDGRPHRYRSVQLANLLGGRWAASLPTGSAAAGRGGRSIVQAIGVFAGAPFVALCRLTDSVALLMTALTCWGLAKGM
jgi:MFS family permease